MADQPDPQNNQPPGYVPPKVWTWDKPNGGQFAAELPNLDPDAEYVVYCRSGNRAGQAVALMEKAGIGAATNAGSLEQAAKATGLAVVE